MNIWNKEFMKDFRKNDRNYKYFFSGILVAFLALIAFIIVISYYNAYKINLPIDIMAIEYVKGIETTALSSVVKVITHIGGTISIITLTLIIIIVLYKKNMIKYSMYFATNMMGIWIFNAILKFYFRRARPTARIINASGYSLPSGHSMVFLTFCSISAYLILIHMRDKKKAVIFAILLVLLAILIGMTRIYLRVHFLSDVLAGWSMALLWSGTSIAIHRCLCYKNRMITIK